jgi:hypothetical protein
LVRVERLFTRCVVVGIDSFFDFWGDSFQHNRQALTLAKINLRLTLRCKQCRVEGMLPATR